MLVDASVWVTVASISLKVATPVASSLIVAIIIHVYRRAHESQDRVVVYGGHRTKRYADQFRELFLRIISQDQQISPNIILKHAASRQAPRSAMALRHMSKHSPNSLIAYQLYLAISDGKVIGFLNALINLRHGYAFIAYLGVATTSAPGKTTQSLLRKLLRQINAIQQPVKVVFEIAPPVKTSRTSKAKFRLFKEYAEARGLDVYGTPFDYVQPDLDPETLDGVTEANADLLVAAAPTSRMTHEDYVSLVESIYYEIYLKTFLDLGYPSNAYASYISTLFGKVSKGAKAKISRSG